MKYKWTEDDVICGRIVCKPIATSNGSEDGWSAKWTHKIGFLAGGNPKKPDAQGKERCDYVLIAMTDGMICSCKTKSGVVVWLNGEGMIPMPHKRLLAVMEYLRDVYES